MNFRQKLEEIIRKNNSLLCIGLDPSLDKLPESVRELNNPLFEFNKAIIDSTNDLVCTYKPNVAFYEAEGTEGLRQLNQTVDYIHSKYTSIPVILDAKRGDIGETSEMYAREVFDVFEADAATVNPYLGKDALLPFLKRKDKGVIILCRTSNKGASDFQDLEINGEPLYLKVAKAVSEWNSEFENCLMVVGATWPEQMKSIREVAKDMFFLVPGIGAQGGDLRSTLENGFRNDKSGLIVSSSRSIIYASSGEDFADTARKEAIELRDKINQYR